MHQAWKAFLENDDRFVLVYQMVNSHLLLPILEFSKSIMNVIELFLILCQAERLPTSLLHEHLKRLIISLMDCFVRPAFLESASSIKKLMMIDLSKKENLLPDKSIDVGFGTTKALKKLKTVQSSEVRNFRKEVRDFMVKLSEKLWEWSPLKYSLPSYLESLSPWIISTHKTELLLNRFKKRLECLHESGWISWIQLI